MKKWLLISAMLCICAAAMAQRVSLTARQQPASSVFRSIVEQTGKNFVYSADLLKDMYVTVEVKNRPLKEALAMMFRHTDVEWKIKGNNIILKKKKAPEGKAQKPVSALRVQPRVSPQAAQPEPKMLEEVVVVSRLESPVVETSEIGAKKLTAQEILNTPVLFGENDVIKALHLQPGISEGQEGLAGMHVHGGDADENLYMLDNIPLYQVNHFAGLISAFNPEAIRYIDFFKSSIPAKYDGRLSSFLDVRTKNGSQQGHHGSFRLGLTSGAFNIDGPIGRNTTYSVALRRSWFEVLTIPIIALANSNDQDYDTRFRYSFMDLNAKVTHRFSPNTTAFASVYFGNDLLNTGSSDKGKTPSDWYEDKFDYNWGNIVASLGANHRFSSALTGEFTAAFTRYFSTMKLDCKAEEKSAGETILSRNLSRTKNIIHDWIFRADFDWMPDDANHARFGANYIRHSFLPASTDRRYSVGDNQIITRDSTSAYPASEANLYFEDDWMASDKLRLNAGLHLSLFSIDRKTYFGYGPRISLSYHPDDNWAVKAAFARTNQYVHQLSETYLSLPSDQWVPVAGSLRPRTADKVSIGGYWQSNNRMFEASVEGYWKVLRNLVDYRDEFYLQPPSGMWNAQLCSGSGTAKGIDFTFRKVFGAVTGHISYSLAWADRKFADKNGGRPFPARFDNRHTIHILLNWNINAKVSLNAAWTGHSGNRFTFLPQVWQEPEFGGAYYGDYAPLKTAVNNYQLPFYHRLDLSCTVRNSRGYWNFGLYNAYCNLNTVAIRRTYNYDGTYGGKPIFQKVRLLPIIPSVSYTWQF